MHEDETEKILLEHFKRYPEMQTADFAKLLYQNEFGGGHLISDRAESLERLKKECEALRALPARREQAFEDIGGGLLRMNIRELGSLGISPETANGFFVETANLVTGSAEAFERKLDVFLQCCRDGKLPIDAGQAERYIRGLKRSGYPAVSHSEAYRGAYAPAYRVVKSVFRDYAEAFRRIDALLKENKTVSVAIDGNCGAGKSALASILSGVYDCNIFHMDDFFLRPEQRTQERLGEPGGNVDYERFADEVIAGLKSGRQFAYRAFECSKPALGEENSVTPKRLSIIEGSYSMHPSLAGFYDLRIFMQTGGREQTERIRSRSGEAMLKRFKEEWIPLEEKYFDAFGVKERCDIVFGTIENNC
jgi:uridine kinase